MAPRSSLVDPADDLDHAEGGTGSEHVAGLMDEAVREQRPHRVFDVLAPSGRAGEVPDGPDRQVLLAGEQVQHVALDRVEFGDDIVGRVLVRHGSWPPVLRPRRWIPAHAGAAGYGC